MLTKFFIQFAGILVAVLVLGFIFSNFMMPANHVEFWILSLLPTFAVPILSAVLFYKEPITLDF